MSSSDPAALATKVAMNVIWASLLGGVILLYFFLRADPGDTPVNAQFSPVNYLGLISLALSVALRWFVLPRQHEPPNVLTCFIVGTALAEGCSILGIFVNTTWIDECFALGVLGIIQYAPFLMPRLFEPRGSDFTSGH